MSKCLHLAGIRRGEVHYLNESSQAIGYTFAFPLSDLCSQFMLIRIRWIAIRPNSSPLYALAAFDASLNKPMIRPLPRKHSRIKAAKHKCGYICLMKDPSVTATNELSVMARATQLVPPSMDICSHNQLHPHSCKTSTNVSKTGTSHPFCAIDVTRKTPGCTLSTEHISPCVTLCIAGASVYRLNFFVVF
jgi:hypothetical protein